MVLGEEVGSSRKICFTLSVKFYFLRKNKELEGYAQQSTQVLSLGLGEKWDWEDNRKHLACTSLGSLF